MTESAVVDAGPIVAFFDPGDADHEWAVETFRRLLMPLVTCEPVLAEAMYLLSFSPQSQDLILDWLGDGELAIAFDLSEESVAVRRLMSKYRDVPMSFADACVVRMAEKLVRHAVCTLDSDFRVYRKHGRAPIRLVAPDVE